MSRALRGVCYVGRLINKAGHVVQTLIFFLPHMPQLYDTATSTR